MNLDITKIVQDKIYSLEKEGTIEKAIEENLEKTILEAVKDAIYSYKVKKDIQEKMTSEISKVVADTDFNTYNSFMIEKMTQIINEHCREDLCTKIESRFRELFLCQTKEIKLSSIFEKYRAIASENVDESEKYDRSDTGWHFKFEKSDYGYFDCGLGYRDKNYRYKRDCDIAFTVFPDYKDKTKGKIDFVYIDGHALKDKFKFGALNDVELMVIQAAMNEIPIIIDIEDEYEIDNSFDVDY